MSRLCLLFLRQQNASKPRWPRPTTTPTTMPAIMPPDALLPDPPLDSESEPLGRAEPVLEVLRARVDEGRSSDADKADQGARHDRSTASGATTVNCCVAERPPSSAM